MKQFNMPRVSVVITAYNEEDYIVRSVDSILAQTYKDYELILLDDGSTDRTWEFIESFDDPRIRKERLKRIGFNRALNHGLTIARGEYIARMDADDESLPQRLERQVEFLDSNLDIGILGTCYYKHDASRAENFIRRHPETDDAIRRAMGFYIPICHGSVMFRKAVVERVGGYNEDLPDSDLELWIRAGRYFKFANLNAEPLYRYWFDPQHSFYENSLRRIDRAWETMKLNMQAVKVFGLPRYYYILIFAKFIYYYGLGSGMKRRVRSMLGVSEHHIFPTEK